MYPYRVAMARVPMIWDFNIYKKDCSLTGDSLQKSYLMNILIFKTNIKHKKDVQSIAPVINNIPSVILWTIDRSDVDKVLRIEATDNVIETICNKIQYAGYSCEELA